MHRSIGWLARSLVVASTVSATAAQADPLRIYAAGSLAGVIGPLVAASGLPPSAVAPPTFGPAGYLRQRIEAGAAADLFASADMAQPAHLAEAGKSGPVVPFARNRFCLVAPEAMGITPATLLDRMLDPHLRLATSTPGSDPGGDYAWAVFARADAVHPGARAALEAKALQLFGGPPGSPAPGMVPMAGHTPGGAILLSGRADALLYYCSGARDVVREVPGSTAIPLPPSLEVGPVYGLTVFHYNPDAERLALFMVSDQGQAILAQHGLLPVLPQEDTAVTIVGPSGQPVRLTASDLRALPAASATLPGEHGDALHLSGPTLWAVLAAGGAIDPNFHHRVRQVLTATGRDGYSATVAIGEIDPEFENKAVLLAVDPEHDTLRLAIPGDKRLGRDVRDIVSLTVR